MSVGGGKGGSGGPSSGLQRQQNQSWKMAKQQQQMQQNILQSMFDQFGSIQDQWNDPEHPSQQQRKFTDPFWWD